MDYGLLIIFLASSIWLYVAFILGVTDWRWNRGRITQCVALAAAGGILILSKLTGMPWALGAVGMFLLTLVFPAFLRRRLVAQANNGRLADARLLKTAIALLTWQSNREVWQTLERAQELIDEAGPHARMLNARAGWMARMAGAGSRWQFLDGWTEALISFRLYDEAIQVFEDAAREQTKPPAAVLYTISVAYGEAGRHAQMLACIQRANELDPRPSPLDIRRFVAYLHLYAQFGRTYALERLLDTHPALQNGIPSAYAGLWRGVALLRQGEYEEGRRLLLSARERIRPGDEHFEPIIDRYLALLPEQAAAPKDAAMEAQLDALEARETAVSAAVRPVRRAAPGRLVASMAIIVACVLVWMATEAAGGSQNTMTLVRFGANVPDLVKNGQWWRLVTSVFLHVGAMHLLFNMYACFLFGGFVERLAGRWQAWVVFIVAGICGSLASAVIGDYNVSAGASGGIFGLLGAAIVMTLTFKDLPAHTRRMYLFNFIFIAAINFLYGRVEANIDELAHAGGMVSGALVGLMLRPIGVPGAHKTFFKVAGIALLGVVAASAGFAMKSVADFDVKPQQGHLAITSPDKSFKIAIPEEWTVVGWGHNIVVLVGPNGANLRVVSVPESSLPVSLEENESLVSEGTREIAGRKYQELIAIAQLEDGEKVAHLAYVLSGERWSYFIQLECAEAEMDEYRQFMAGVLEKFQPLK